MTEFRSALKTIDHHRELIQEFLRLVSDTSLFLILLPHSDDPLPPVFLLAHSKHTFFFLLQSTQRLSVESDPSKSTMLLDLLKQDKNGFYRIAKVNTEKAGQYETIITRTKDQETIVCDANAKEWHDATAAKWFQALAQLLNPGESVKIGFDNRGKDGSSTPPTHRDNLPDRCYLILPGEDDGRDAEVRDKPYMPAYQLFVHSNPDELERQQYDNLLLLLLRRVMLGLCLVSGSSLFFFQLLLTFCFPSQMPTDL